MDCCFLIPSCCNILKTLMHFFFHGLGMKEVSDFFKLTEPCGMDRKDSGVSMFFYKGKIYNFEGSFTQSRIPY